MKLKAGLALLMLAATAPSAAFAGGNLAMMPTGLTPLSDMEMGKLRGGDLPPQVFFNILFGGTIEPNPNAPPPSITVNNGQASVSTVIGNFAGASGIFQIAQVPGSFNIVNNNLFIQIAVINVLNGASIPSLNSLLH